MNSIVDEAAQPSRMSANLIDGESGAGSFNHFQSYESNTTNKETYTHLPDTIISTAKYDYPCSTNVLSTAVDPKLGDWEQASIEVKHTGVISASPNGHKIMSTSDKDTVKHVDLPEASLYTPVSSNNADS